MFISNESLSLPGQGQVGAAVEREAIQQEGDILTTDGVFLPDATVVDVPDTAGNARSMPNWGPPSVPGGSDYPVTLPSFPDRPVWPGNGFSNVRFLCAAADRPAINISIGRRRVINAMHFGNSTPFFQERAGEHVIVCTDQWNNVVYRGTFSFAAGMAYTLALYNDNRKLQMYVIPEEGCSSWGRNGCLRVVNLMEYMDPMDIFLTNAGRVFRDVSRSEVTGLRQVPAGTYRTFVAESMPCSSGFTLGENYISCFYFVL